MKKEPEDNGRLLDRTRLAQALGVSAGTITRWERDGMPVAKKFTRGRSSLFDLEAVTAWRQQVEASKAASGSLSLEQERAKLAVVQREKLELDMAVRRGELLELDAVVTEGQQYSKAISAKVRALPRMLTHAGLIDRSRESAVSVLLFDLLTDISNWKFIEDLAKAARLRNAS